jgi:phage terminase small subunit
MPRKVQTSKLEPEPPADIVKAALTKNMQPLEYMLAVMNDPYADRNRRDKMAIAAAPYCHPKMADQRLGKKDQETEAATVAGIGTPWAADLEFENRAN